MPLLFHLLLAFVTALLTVTITTPIVKTIGFRCGYVDVPAGRKIHQLPIVRIGGISICFATLVALLLITPIQFLHVLPVPMVTKLGWLMLGSVAFFLIGLADDLLNLSPLLRLLLQLNIASLIWFAGIRIEFLTIPYLGLIQLGWVGLPITLLWIVGVVNAINWTDGLDGLASGVSGIAAIVILIVCLFMGQTVAAIVMAALGGSLLGFLYYNFNPAQIFMGDGGSYFIGFTIAGSSILGLAKAATALAILLPLLILAVPILDMSAVIVARVRGGRSPFVADKSHLHHRLLEAGLSHRFTVFVIYSLSIWAGSLAIALAGIPNYHIIFAIATGLLACMLWQAWRVARQS
jgi:UDP-GlcNAc:undecaprenyl-phosphate/decaprenyl-phosphate GlcNAc-1-phosphate transferase